MDERIDEHMIVERYNFSERFTHFIHLVSLFTLIITGAKIYAGYDFMSYHDARALHIISAIVFLIANWILVPYNTVSSPCVKCVSKWKHLAHRYIFGPTDVKRLLHALPLIGSEQPAPITVYHVARKHYEDKLHPGMQLLINLEIFAIFIVALTGIVLYDPDWGYFGLPVGKTIMGIGDAAVGLLGIPVSTMGFMRILHLLMMYWFAFEVIVHVGVIYLDPRLWKYYKSIFWTGEEDLRDKAYVELIYEKEDAIG